VKFQFIIAQYKHLSYSIYSGCLFNEIIRVMNKSYIKLEDKTHAINIINVAISVTTIQITCKRSI